MKIAISENAQPPVAEAAAEFLETVRLLCGAKIGLQTFGKDERPAAGTVVLGTFCDFPFLRDEFSEDEKNLRESDGFSVRLSGGNLYIFSHVPGGVFFGVCDFTERNWNVIRSRGKRGEERIVTSVTELVAATCDYTIKPAFAVRGWNICGLGEQGNMLDRGTVRYLAANKNNVKFFVYDEEYARYGVKPFGEYFSEADDISEELQLHPEYFMKTAEGNPKRGYINYYHAGAAARIAEKIVTFIGKNPSFAEGRTINLLMPDDMYFYMEEDGAVLSEKPFVTDDGNTVVPTDENYKSTVYFNFINRIVKKVGEVYPKAQFVTLAYLYAEACPSTRISEKLWVGVAPILTNDHIDYLSDPSEVSRKIAKNIETWCRRAQNVFVYNYWQCFRGEIYSRPSVYVVQKILKWYRSVGVKGIVPEGRVDRANLEGDDDFYDMNEMYCWQMNRLLADPDENVDDLTKWFCREAYGDAADEMREYYALIQKGWDERDDYVFYATGGDIYIGQFILAAGIAEPILDALNRALQKKLTAVQHRKIGTIRRILSEQIGKYSKRQEEEAEATYCGAGTERILSDEMMQAEENADSVWNRTKKLVVFQNYETFEDYDRRAKFNVRMLWDEKYLYIGFQVFDDKLAESAPVYNVFGQPVYKREDGSQVESYTETYLGGNILNMSEYYGYITGMFLTRNRSVYINRGVPEEITVPRGFREAFYCHYDCDPQKRYYFHVQAIAFDDLGVSCDTARPYGSFVYYTDRYGRTGWKGNALWCKPNFSEFRLIGREERKKT